MSSSSYALALVVATTFVMACGDDHVQPERPVVTIFIPDAGSRDDAGCGDGAAKQR